MTSTKYIGLDVHKESISIAVLNSAGKVVMECVIETKASTILQFVQGLRGDLHVTLEEGTWAGWLFDLLKPYVTELIVCNPRKNALLKEGSKSDRIDAHKLAELLYMKKLKPVYHGEHGLRMLEFVLRTPFGPGGAAKPMPDGRKPEPGGWNRIIFNVDDLSAEVARLRSAQLHFRNDIVSGPGGSEILLDDPSGNPIELFQPAC
jgi:predicted enzyme related to lactoylglutathione lyase